jgi:secreted trypsin-like serine protease
MKGPSIKTNRPSDLPKQNRRQRGAAPLLLRPHRGITTGYRCGQITSTSSTTNYGGSVIIYHMREATDCAYEGDSGGPFYTSGIGGVNAEGIESGITCASSTCSTSNVTGSIYSFITNAEAYATATVNSFP